MKSPNGKGKSTLEHIFRKAAHQSENIILDLRRFKGKNQDKNIHQIEQRFLRSRRVKRMYIITKNGKLIYLPKKINIVLVFFEFFGIIVVKESDPAPHEYRAKLSFF